MLLLLLWLLLPRWLLLLLLLSRAPAPALAVAPALALTPSLAFALPLLLLSVCSKGIWSFDPNSEEVLKGRDDFGRIRANVLLLLGGMFNKRGRITTSDGKRMTVSRGEVLRALARGSQLSPEVPLIQKSRCT